MSKFRVVLLILLASSLALGDKLQQCDTALNTCKELNLELDKANTACRKELGECIDKATPHEGIPTIYIVVGSFIVGAIAGKVLLK